MTHRLLPVIVLLAITLPTATAQTKAVIAVKDVEVKARSGKTMGTLHVFVAPGEDPVRFIKANRCIAGTWDFSSTKNQESRTHWTGVMHYPTFNHRPEQFYVRGNIRIIKQGRLDKVPEETRAKLVPLFRKREPGQAITRQTLLLRQTGKPNEHEVIGYSSDDVFGLFKLNTKLTYTGTPGPMGSGEKPIRIWPGKAPDEPAGIAEKKAEPQTGADGVIRIPYVDTPELIRFPANPRNATGTCMIVCPGGGYGKLAWNKEGTEIAAWLATLGVDAVALKYRVPRRDREKPHPWPLQDLQRSIRLVRSRAAEWNISPQRLGIIGFSAGGHLAVMSASYQNENSYQPIDAIDKLDVRPNFMALIYPAYLGNSRKDATQLDPLVKVDAKTPPTFIAITHDDADRGLFSALYYAQLQRNRVPAELHIYSKGGHGYGLRPSANPVSSWPARLEDWLRAGRWISPKDEDRSTP